MKKILYKKLEQKIFTSTDTNTIISYYGFFAGHFLERFDITSPDITEALKIDLSENLKKAVLLYKENKNYEKEYNFFVYCTYFFAETINKYIENYPTKIIKLETLSLEDLEK